MRFKYFYKTDNIIKFLFPLLGELLIFTPFLFVLSTVFIIDNSLYNGVVSGKYFWFYGSMGLAVLATLFKSFNPSIPQSFNSSILDIFVFLFVGSVFLSAFLFSDVSANTTKLTLLALLLVLYACLRMVLSKWYLVNDKFQTIICFFIILTGLVEAVWGLMQLYGFRTSQHGLFKLTGSFFNPGPYAGYLAVVFPMALYELRTKSEDIRTKSYELKVKNFSLLVLNSYLLTLIAIFLVLPAAMSRAAWLAAIAGSIVVIFHFPFTIYHLRLLQSNIYNLPFIKGKRQLYSSLLVLIFSIFTLSLFFGMYHLKKNSADGRLLTWKVSLNVVAKNPFGVGLGHFPSAYGEAQAAYFASGKASETEEYVAGNPEYGFNEFLQIAIESGVVSLGLFIAMVFFAIKGLIKEKRYGIMGSLVALLVFACFSYPFSILPFAIIFVFLLAMSNIDRTQITQKPQINAKRKFSFAIISVFCAICVLTTIYKQYPVYGAYKQWNKSRMYYQTEIYGEAAASYEPLYPYLKDQINFLFEYGRSLSQAGINDSQGIAGQARNDSVGEGIAGQALNDRLVKSKEVLQQAAKISCDPMLYNIMGRNYQAMKEYDLAEQSLLKSTLIVPNRLYPWYLLMKLYAETGDKEKARETAEIVLTKEPKVQSTAVREMREEAERVKN